MIAQFVQSTTPVELAECRVYETEQKKAAFLDSIPLASIELPTDTLAKRCKFNFSYFTVQKNAGQAFSDLNPNELVALLEKLSHFSADSLEHWRRTPIGKKSGHVLEIYESFPIKSKFVEPAHIPHQRHWGRFRLDSATRLIGFVLPDQYHGTLHPCGFTFDRNTFYVVFMDKNHEFYLMDKK